MIEVWTIYVAPHHFTSPVTNWRDLRAICIATGDIGQIIEDFGEYPKTRGEFRSQGTSA